ncbi:MAG: hydantoinase/oxoprolinase family protein [Acetobacteraceae bacterium]|nr:hydantoinase/oxoprolinase family protein [Acetobacteraceae bacterium]
MNGRFSVGIDIGGTFTDVVLMNGEGTIVAKHKVDTTAALEQCFLHGLGRAATGLDRRAIGSILHATTVATNTVLEGKGARTALLVTEGFRDVLEIARQRRPSLYDLKAEKPRPLVPRRLVAGVAERIGGDGEVVTPLNEAEMARVADWVRTARAEAVVISFLFSYLNPAHETALKRHLEAALPDTAIVASSEVIPEFREFERTSTAVLVGYLKPIFERYTRRLDDALAREGYAADKLQIMNSAGGVMSPAAARERPHTIVESGPAAGVIAAAVLAQEMDEPNLISFDMGGTTAKASLVQNGQYRTTSEYEIGAGLHQSLAMRFTGYPIRAPIIDLTECSAGGGSIAWVDGLGALKVGPRSAGADPGPVCYRRGGLEPTVTDANLVLGRINPDYFVGGEAQLDAGAAHRAIEQRIAEPLGLSLTAAAAGIIAVANAQMVRILRVVSVARGLDPRGFAMLAFGGAGPLHAASLAAEMGIARVIVPEAPGLFSALGLLWADLRADFSATANVTLAPENAAALQSLLEGLEREAETWLEGERVPARRRALLRSGDMRYPLQNYEVSVPLPAGRIAPAWMARAAEAFHAAHEQLYGYRDPAAAVKLVNLRVAALGRTARAHPPARTLSGTDPSAARKPGREVYFEDSGYVACAIYERDRLVPGNRIPGPGIVEQADSTILIPPAFMAEIDPHARLVMTRSAAAAAAEAARVAEPVP